jgi:hypothetical protein
MQMVHGNMAIERKESRSWFRRSRRDRNSR